MASVERAASHFARSSTLERKAPLGRNAMYSTEFSILSFFHSYPSARFGTIALKLVGRVAVIPRGEKTRSFIKSTHGFPEILVMISASEKYPTLQYSYFSPGAKRSGTGYAVLITSKSF